MGDTNIIYNYKALTNVRGLLKLIAVTWTTNTYYQLKMDTCLLGCLKLDDSYLNNALSLSILSINLILDARITIHRNKSNLVFNSTTMYHHTCITIKGYI